MKKTLDPTINRKMRRTFRKLRHKVSYINQGGCGVFAVCLAKILRKLGYDARIVALNNISSLWGRDEEDIINHNQELRRAKQSNTSPYCTKAHYMVRVGNTYIDSQHIKPCLGRKMWLKKESGERWLGQVILGNVPIESLAYLNDNGDAWNSNYRRNQTPLLESILKQSL